MADGMTNEERRGLCKFSSLCRVPVERCHECKGFMPPDVLIFGRQRAEIERMQLGKVR